MNHAKIIKNNRCRTSTYTFINFFNLSNDYLCVKIKKKIDLMNHAKIIKNYRGRQSTYTFINFFNLSNDYLCVKIKKNRYNESCKNH